MSKFIVGNIVTVEDWGRQFSTYTDWFIAHKDEIPIQWMIHYSYNNQNYYHKPIDMRYMVLYVDNDMCLIGSYVFEKLGDVYLIDEDGIELASRRMTQAEIERTLGYKIEIVEDDEDEDEDDE